jgi:hypothetical protein
MLLRDERELGGVTARRDVDQLSRTELAEVLSLPEYRERKAYLGPIKFPIVTFKDFLSPYTEDLR